MSYRVASFNINNTTKKGDDGRSKPKDGREFAKIISDERLDIIALQEYRAKSELSGEDEEEGVAQRVPDFLLISMIKSLNSPWRRWKYVRAKTNSTGREYAILWNDRRVNLIADEMDSRLSTKYRRDYNKTFIHGYKWQMKREPLIARFIGDESAVHPRCEIRLIDFHLWHGNPYTAEQHVNQRKEECALVNGFIYDRVNVITPPNGETVFTIALGDYNLNCGECNEINRECGHPNIVTVQEDLSTLNKRIKDHSRYSDGFSNSYDHFSYDEKYEDAVKGKPTIIAPVNGDFTYHLKNISDHVPVVIEIL
jgi:hypothetical protein